MIIVYTLATFATVALVIIALITILNVLTFPKLDKAPLPKQTPLVSVLIPARNEAAVIKQTIRRLLTQDYTNLEVIVLVNVPPLGAGFDWTRNSAAY